MKVKSNIIVYNVPDMTSKLTVPISEYLQAAADMSVTGTGSKIKYIYELKKNMNEKAKYII